MTAQRFGTGATPTEVVKTEGPGIARTFVNGVALALGWFTVVGAIKLVQKSLADDEYDPSLDEVDEVSGYSPRDVILAHDLKAERARKKRVERLIAEDEDDD